MGELILCNQMLAAFPYYIDNASLGVYSMEELSYYIVHNVDLLEADFMNEELCAWIERELKLKEAAAQLREILRKGGTLSEFVTCILMQSGYCNREEIRRLAATLAEMENKSEYECGKIRADRYASNGRYTSAINEYRRLLAREDEKNEILVGNVWHNMGKAFACLFLFPEAADCLKRAYDLNHNPESLRECLYAYRCMRDEQGFKETADAYGLTAEQASEIRESLTEMSRMEPIRQFETQLSELFDTDQKTEICGLVNQWKDTYRKNCRI